MVIGDEFKVLGVVGWAFTSKYPNSLLFSVKVPAFAHFNRMLLDLGRGGGLHGRRHRRLGGDQLHQVQVDGVCRI